MNKGYAICLNEWLFDTSIKNELPLLLYISSLTAESGYCYASNRHLAEKLNIHEITVSKAIKKLCDKGYINTEIVYKKGTKQIDERRIFLNNLETIKNIYSEIEADNE